MSENVVLKVNRLGIDFGGLTAVNNFNMEIMPNEIIGLIGPNGAGKTTVFNLLTKVYEPTRGEIYLNDKSLEKMSTVEVNQLGIARTFQNIRLFSNMSVLENVLIGEHNGIAYKTVNAIFRTPSYYKEEKAAKAERNQKRAYHRQYYREKVKPKREALKAADAG